MSSNKETKVKANLDGLNKLTRMLKDDKFLRVGIIGNKATAQHGKDGLTNAELGTYHEFGGTSKHGKEQPPQRSFLSMPLKEQLKFDNAEMKEIKKVLWKQFFVKKSPDEFWQALMGKALDVIEEAFDTGGWGQWKPLATSTEKMIAKKHKMLSPDDLRNYKLSKREISTGKLKKKFIKSDEFWTGSLYQDAETGEYKVSHGRMPLTETRMLRESISAKIMKRK